MKRFDTAGLLLAGMWTVLAGNNIGLTQSHTLDKKVEQRVSSQDEATIRSIIEVGRTDSQVMQHLDILSNRIGARLTGSPALQEAARWAADRFRDFGLENARMIEAGTIPIGFYRGQQSGWMIEPDKKPLYFGTSAWSAGTKGVQRGPALLAPSRRDFEERKDKFRGAWVLTEKRERPKSSNRAGDETRKEQEKEQEKGQEEQQGGQVSDEELIRAGVAGLVRSAASERIITGGRWPRSWEELPTTPSVNMGKSNFDEIRELLKAGRDVVLEFDIRNHFRKGPVSFPNVIADIPGTDFLDEYVIIGAHLDSHDEGAGTVDDGVGVATTMEAARILMVAGVRPRRTIRFMLWGGEEQGCYGSKNYVRDNPELMTKISAVFVHDLGSNYLSSIRVTQSMQEDFETVLAPVMSLNPEYPFCIEIVESVKKGSSDHDSFIEKGVPGFLWRQSGRADYSVGHTQRDTYDKAIAEYQEHSAIVVALTAYGVAHLDHLISRAEMPDKDKADISNTKSSSNE